jgi:hypothetical protein
MSKRLGPILSKWRIWLLIDSQIEMLRMVRPQIDFSKMNVVYIC